MTSNYIERILWFQDKDERRTVPQDELLKRNEPLVVLGEAGMGKSELLGQLSEAEGYSFCTANQLTKRFNPKDLLTNAQTLVIDGLDEVSSQRTGDAVDLVLQKLGELGYPNFILSCRVADWRGAIGSEAIKEQYSLTPIEFHLEPFTDDDSVKFLSSSLGEDAAIDVIEHFNQRGLNGLLSNPQTLNLIRDVVNKGSLPETKSELFERATEVLWGEHKDNKSENSVTREIAIDAAGAAFASLILTGNEAIVRKAPTRVKEGELRLEEVACLPGARNLKNVLDSRLFKSLGTDRFGYLHRSIGEFLGARWLAKQAITVRQRERLLRMFSSNGLVPTSLRGLHAWLAATPAFTKMIIHADPMGLIEYGDADNLSIEQGKYLLENLELLAAQSPYFRSWSSYSAGGLIQPALMPDLRRLIIEKKTPSGLRVFVLDLVKGTKLASEFANDIKSIVLNPKEIFACRRAAGEALVGLIDNVEWPAIMNALKDFDDDLSIRLAIELLKPAGFANLSDELITELVKNYSEKKSDTVGVLYSLKRILPDERLIGILNCVTEKISQEAVRVEYQGVETLTGFAYYLIARVLKFSGVHENQLWFWLEQLNTLREYDKDSQKEIFDFIKKNEQFRKSFYKLVILDCDGDESIWFRICKLSECLSNFQLDNQDFVNLLLALDPSNSSDDRWRELVEVSCNQGSLTDEVFSAAFNFTRNQSDLIIWLEKKKKNVIPKWKLEDDERLRNKMDELALKYENSRKKYHKKIMEVESGEYSFIVDPARAYLNILRDIEVSEVPAAERISKWLGSDIQKSVYLGFKEFLNKSHPSPDAKEIAADLAKDIYWHAGFIIVAALAEEYRAIQSFAQVSDERLIAGLLMIRRTKIDSSAGIGELEDSVRECLIARGLWEQTMRLYYEPLLNAGRYPIGDLSLLLWDKYIPELALKLSVEWLKRFNNLPSEVEFQLTDVLLFNSEFNVLRNLVAERVNVENVERRLNWTAISIIIDFDNVHPRFDNAPVNPDLLWYFRDCARGGSRGEDFLMKNIEKLKWIIQTFRSVWPLVHEWDNITSRGQSSYEASVYIVSLLKRLANNTDLASCSALRELRDSTLDSYTQTLKELVLEQTKLKADVLYTPQTVEAIKAITSDSLPVTVSDLQIVILDELKVVQAKIKSDDVESWQGFYADNNIPYQEERCRDHLIGLLRQSCHGVNLEPETHVAADKEVDISCSVGHLRLPIEVKGQWHADLWHASDTQLDRLYTKDWKAEDCGIYLVLWFGKYGKPLTSPGRRAKRPTTPEQLHSMLVARSPAVQEGRVGIFVLDLERG